ncbi:MAG: hypothetical protein H6734_11940 [Alphaproteobacteria bacterium]|nr:hypothetical protein [Alphaproteobacteria bacterium]
MYAVGDWVNVGALGALGRVVDVRDVYAEVVDVGPTAMVWAQAEVGDAEPPVVTALTLVPSRPRRASSSWSSRMLPRWGSGAS